MSIVNVNSASPCVERHPHWFPLDQCSRINQHPVHVPVIWILTGIKRYSFTVESDLARSAISGWYWYQVKSATTDGVREVSFSVLIVGVEIVFPVAKWNYIKIKYNNNIILRNSVPLERKFSSCIYIIGDVLDQITHRYNMQSIWICRS